MTKTTHTKKALLASMLSLLLCFAMLIGTTFAWFTDSVTSKGNKIQSGTLNIDLLVKDRTETEYTSVKESQKAIFDYDKWEPGYTEVKHVKVSTTGNLALKYILNIIPAGTLDDDAMLLASVIDVYYANEEVTVPDRDLAKLVEAGTIRHLGTLDKVFANTESVIEDKLIPSENQTEDYATIVLQMKTSADNKYQGKSIGEGFDLQLLATQYTYEKDSFDEMYDEKATYPVTTADEMKNAFAALNTNDTAIIDVQADISATMDVVNGQTTLYTIPENSKVTLKLNDNTLDVSMPDRKVASNQAIFTVGRGATLIIEDGEFALTSGANDKRGSAIISNNAGTVIINDGTFSHTLANGPVIIPCLIDNNSSGGKANLTINGGTFNVSGVVNMIRNFVNGNDATITINGGTFNGENSSTCIWNQNANTTTNTNNGTKGYMYFNGGDFTNVCIDNDNDTTGTLIYEIADGVAIRRP